MHKTYNVGQGLAFAVTRLGKRLATQKKSYAIVCLFGLLVAALEMLPPRLAGHLTNELIRGKQLSVSVLIACVAAWVLVMVTTQLMHSMQILHANRAGQRVLASIRMDIFEKLQRLPMSYFHRNHIGKVMAYSGNDLESLQNLMSWGLNLFFANLALIILSSLMILMTDLQLFLAVIWLVPAVSVISYLYGSRVNSAWNSVREHSALVGSIQAENISGIRIVKAFNRQERNFRHFSRMQHINTKNNVAASRLSGMFQPLLQWMRFGGQAILLTFGGFKVITGRMDAGSLVAVSLYWEWLMQPAIAFGALFNDALVAISATERIFSFLELRPDDSQPKNPIALPPVKGDVRFENVSFGYFADRPILHNIDFKVQAGATVALVGATGSGKSTIVSLIARFYQPQQGRVLFDGKDIRDATRDSLAKQIAIVPQSNFLFGGTIMDNLKYARPSASDEEVFAAARTLGCHDRILSLEHGYDTPVGEKGCSISLGECQLICFTRALIADPRILLLDEATSAIDPITEAGLQQALRRLSAGRTTFIVAHRLSTIMNADVILVLDQGRIVEIGTHGELSKRSEGHYAKLWSHSRNSA